MPPNCDKETPIQTVRVRLEQALQRERAMLASVTAATDVMLVYLDPEFNFVWVNQAYADTCHFTPEEMVGKNHFDLYPHPENEAIFRQVRDTGQPIFFKDRPFEFQDQPERGVTYWDWSLSAVMNDGKVDGLVLSLRETTSYVRALQAQQDSEVRYKRLFEHMSEGFVVLETVEAAGESYDFRFLDVNPAFETLTGLRRETVVGQCLRAVLPNLEPYWFENYRQVMLSGEPAHFENYAQALKRWYSVYAYRATPKQIAVVFTDATQRRAADEALRAAMADAERANNAKSRFLAAASHDLRQPLAALGIYGSALESHVAPAGQPLLANMKDCIASLGELLNDLLDLSKLEAGVVEPTPSHFAIGDLLAHLEAVHLPDALSKGLRLRFVPTRQVAHTDRVLIQRLLGNLIANAIRYTERGGVAVGCRRREGRIWIEVWDTGIGIPQDKTSEIFEEFRQLDHGARTRGSGLGLAIVARTAALLGLAIRVRSQLGKGSLFAIEIPVGDRASAAAATSGFSAGYRSLRVAIVEDNFNVRTALLQALSGVGHAVIAAATGLELAQDIEAFRPDILIADYRLANGATGIEAIKAARKTLGYDLPALLLTGDTDPRLVRSLASSGIVVLHKPVDFETLQAYMEDLTYQGALGG